MRSNWKSQYIARLSWQGQLSDESIFQEIDFIFQIVWTKLKIKKIHSSFVANNQDAHEFMVCVFYGTQTL